MVDTYGRWTEEKDYSTYPKEKWCDYDYMAAWIRKQGYEPKTDMENLITMIFSYYLLYGLFYYDLSVDRHTEQCFRVPIEHLNKT